MRLVRVVTSTRSSFFDALVGFFHQVVHLVDAGPHFDGRVQQAGGPDELLHDESAGLFQLVIGGRGADKNDLIDQFFKLREIERSVVHSAGQPEAEIDQIELARAVAAVHAAHLREGGVALVNEHEVVVGEVIEQAKRAGAFFSAVEKTGVVFHAAAIAQFFDHFQIKIGAFAYALGFHILALPRSKYFSCSYSSSSMALMI
jgi:hypothetical protein